jgi:hypothetical protein
MLFTLQCGQKEAKGDISFEKSGKKKDKKASTLIDLKYCKLLL